MDETLERIMREHLDGAMEREKELAVMRNRLQRGDDNFAELTEKLDGISENVTRIVFLLDGCKDQEGIVCKVNAHEKFFQKFFGAIGFLTFMGVTTIGITLWYIWQWIKHKVGGV